MAYSLIEFTRPDEGVAQLRLNRPEKRNALSLELWRELGDGLREFRDDRTLKVLVITGGPQVFCAGLDLDAVGNLTGAAAAEFNSAAQAAFELLLFGRKPSIAAVSGVAYAGGFDLAVCCDMRVASETARFAQTEVRFGLAPLTDPLWRIIGLAKARELALTAAPIDAQEAYRIGLVNRLTPVDQFLEEALGMARQIAAHPLSSIQSTKETTNIVPGLDIAASMRFQWAQIGLLFGREESRERARAFFTERGKKG